jgi:hypothetical protein
VPDDLSGLLDAVSVEKVPVDLQGLNAKLVVVLGVHGPTATTVWVMADRTRSLRRGESLGLLVATFEPSLKIVLHWTLISLHFEHALSDLGLI